MFSYKLVLHHNSQTNIGNIRTQYWTFHYLRRFQERCKKVQEVSLFVNLICISRKISLYLLRRGTQLLFAVIVAVIVVVLHSFTFLSIDTVWYSFFCRLNQIKREKEKERDRHRALLSLCVVCCQIVNIIVLCSLDFSSYCQGCHQKPYTLLAIQLLVSVEIWFHSPAFIYK